MNFDGKVAVITGSSRGIGKAIAEKFASMKACVVLNSRNVSGEMEETHREFTDKEYKSSCFACDICTPEGAQNLVDFTVKTYGSIDILVNNAGITKDKPLMLMSEEDWDSVLDINLKGAFLCSKFASKAMIKKRYGKIVNITSVSGRYGNPGQANYSASKAGMIGLTKTCAKELAKRGINVNAVAPGFIESKMTESLPEDIKKVYLSSISMGRFGKDYEVADLVAFLASDMAGYITGQIIDIDGGLLM